ncbi:MAG: M14 family metallopeptidase [Phycisphaerales bacterium]
MVRRLNRRALPIVAAALLTGVGVPSSDAMIQPAYRDHEAMTQRVNSIASAHSELVTVESIGASREGRSIWAMTVAGPGDIEPAKRPALLLVANIDGDHLVGSEVALEVVDGLLTRFANGHEAAVQFLNEHTLYVVPRVNPDAAEFYWAPVKDNRRVNTRPVDRDRDRQADEDPPNDLNGDGLITMMRVFDPDDASLRADPADPRLSVSVDRDKGERAEFTLMVEGVDDDQDGEINEDGPGGVDLNRNFMHGYEEHGEASGPHQVSEPESLALLEFALARQNIAAVLVYGRHDNLSSTPDGKGSDDAGAPRNINSDDVGIYRQVGERFKEITGLKTAPNDDAGGAFFAWAYAQYGVPSFTTPLWTRPEPKKDEEPAEETDAEPAPEATDDTPSTPADDAGPELTPSGVGDISLETLEELRSAAEDAGIEVTDEMVAQLTPDMVERYAGQMGVEVKRVASDDAASNGEAMDKEEAAWLKYSDDERGGDGFVEWTKYEHPEFGEVEIGGWAPYFKTNPPAEEIGAIAERQVEFILDLASRLPEVHLEDPEITQLASGLYEIKAAVVNDGYFPTGTAMAVRNRRARPYVVRLSIPDDQIVTGQRVHKTWSIPGSGGRESYRWIVGAPDGSEFTITLYSEKYGTVKRSFTLDGGAEQ